MIAEIDAALPELRAALGWLLDHGEVELAGRLVAALLDYGFLRLRPDVLAWAERVAAADPDDRSPLAAAGVGGRRLRRVDGRRRRRLRRARRPGPAGGRAGRGGDPPAEVAAISGNDALFEGRLDEAVEWYRRAVESRPADDLAQRLFMASTELLALAYAGDPTAAAERADEPARRGRRRRDPARRLRLVLRRRGRPRRSTSSGPASRFARADRAGRADRRVVRHRPRRRVEGVDRRPRRRPGGRRRRLPPADRPLAAGRHVVDPVDDAALDRRPARPPRPPRDAAVLDGAVRATDAGHRIFGADEVALAELGDAAARRARRRRLRGGAATRAPRSTATPPSSTPCGRCDASPSSARCSDRLTSGAARRGCRARPCRPARG